MALSASFFFFLLVETTTAAFAGDTDTTATSAGVAVADNSSMPGAMVDYPMQYICYVCYGRNPLLIRWCPIDLDTCFLYCFPPATTAASALPPFVGAAGAGNDDDCYVMKLYDDGRYVIVSHVRCARVAGCRLLCSKGEKRALAAAAPASPIIPPQRDVADFQRCGDQ